MSTNDVQDAVEKTERRAHPGVEELSFELDVVSPPEGPLFRLETTRVVD